MEGDFEILLFSMRGVSVIDTTGVAYLSEVCQACVLAGKQVALCGVNDAVQHRVVQSGLSEIIGEDHIYWSVDKALVEINEKMPCVCTDGAEKGAL